MYSPECASSSDNLESREIIYETGLSHECGVFGCVASHPWPTHLDVANVISLGLLGLQHRGQESAGVVTGSGKIGEPLNIHKGMGLVSHIFNAENLSNLNGNLGLGHTRYSTEGKSQLLNCQPFVVDTMHGSLAVAHNGELVNKKTLRHNLLKRGIGLSSFSDSEVITQILCIPPSEDESSGPNWLSRIKYLMEQTPLAYSLLIMNGGDIFAARDPFGNRPLCIGILKSPHTTPEKENRTDGWIVSSESCVFHSIGAKLHREILPGEIVKLSPEGVKSLGIVSRPKNTSPALCIFEYVYFARPDSVIGGQMVYSARYRCGRKLAAESPVEADIVSCVPESSSPAAFGYSFESGIPFMEVLAKNRYIGRTFIQPSTRLRQLAVSKKFGPLRENLIGKRVVLIDDSIVRGNTMGPIVKMLREGGATEVHIRIASPPIRHACYMGINIPDTKELIANNHKLDEIFKFFNADSLAYLSLDGLLKSVQSDKNESVVKNSDQNEKHCVACLNGKYPVKCDW